MSRPPLEPDGGNVYKEHYLQITSGQLWRCKHGSTGYDMNMYWVGCDECKKDDPAAYFEWCKHHTSELDARIPWGQL